MSAKDYSAQKILLLENIRKQEQYFLLRIKRSRYGLYILSIARLIFVCAIPLLLYYPPVSLPAVKIIVVLLACLIVFISLLIPVLGLDSNPVIFQTALTWLNELKSELREAKDNNELIIDRIEKDYERLEKGLEIKSLSQFYSQFKNGLVELYKENEGGGTDDTGPMRR
jgi:hypothetical protein